MDVPETSGLKELGPETLSALWTALTDFFSCLFEQNTPERTSQQYHQTSLYNVNSIKVILFQVSGFIPFRHNSVFGRGQLLR